MIVALDNVAQVPEVDHREGSVVSGRQAGASPQSSELFLEGEPRMPYRLGRHILVAAFGACLVGALPSRPTLADEAPIGSGQMAGGKVRADILSLKRSEGNTVTLRFAITNDGNQALSTVLGNMRLIDLVNRRSYSPGVTSSSCRTEPGARSLCWAIFGAPIAGAKTINIKFDENFELISAPIAD